MPLSLRPWTLTDPEQIPAEGADVTFTIEARSPGVPERARFTFELEARDGYEWSEGGTAVRRTVDLLTTWKLYDFELGLRQRQATGARVLMIPVEGSLVDEDGNPTSAVKKSLAMLTVDTSNLAATIRSWRESSGASQQEVAQRLGISIDELVEIDNGEHPATEETLRRIKDLVES